VLQAERDVTLSLVRPQERVAAALARLGLGSNIAEFAESTSTAEEAARAVGCELGQIVKTLFFLAEGRPTLALVAGDRQVDTAALASLLGVGRKRLKMATPEQTLALTGYEVGGIAPVGVFAPADVVLDRSLERFEDVWAAAGTPNAVFAARTGDLARAVRGQWADITRERP
jgi:Cys-tRNA(Pro) deacylase